MSTEREQDDGVLERLKASVWPAGWVPRLSEIEHWVAGHSTRTDTELVAEVGPGHVLDGYAAQAILIADQNGASDDYVYFLPQGPAPFAVVHLTWSGKQDPHPEFPSTELIPSVEELQRFLVEHPHGI